MANKKITELPAATTPIVAGVKFEAVQGGVNVQVDASDLPGGIESLVAGTNITIDDTDPANPIISASGGGGGDVTNAEFRRARVVTGADSVVQADDNGLVIFNSATPFNFTLDQLTANLAGNETTKVSFINIGAGAVTFIAGSGVTITGSVVLSGAIGTEYPSAVVFYHTATTPRVLNSGANDLALVTVSTAGATITLDFNNEKERMFVGSASFATAKDVEIEPTTLGNALLFNLVLTITNVAAVLTFPLDFAMPATDSRWNDAAKTFTVPTGATGKYEFSASWDGTEWNMKATNQFA